MEDIVTTVVTERVYRGKNPNSKLSVFLQKQTYYFDLFITSVFIYYLFKFSWVNKKNDIYRGIFHFVIVITWIWTKWIDRKYEKTG